MDFGSFPTPPNQQPIYSQKAYTTDGKPVQADTYAPQHPSSGRLGANFSGLIGNHVTVPAPIQGKGEEIVTEKKKRGRPRKNPDENGVVKVETGEVDAVDKPVANLSKEIVENTIYGDIYNTTNRMTVGIIAQTDELLAECKMELDAIRANRALKGRYHYMNATVASMGALLGTKLQAIKEINSNIKSSNEMEYRRFKDMRAMDQTDDNKAIMDAYTAFISAPVGAPAYTLPGTAALTAATDGIVPANYPKEVQGAMDAEMHRYLSNLTPEENLMLQDGNKNLKEVIIYDEATGVKKFAWMDMSTGEEVPNLPISPDIVLEDYTIDPRTGTAKNTNLNSTMKVIVKNKGAFDQY